jgi:hypothetical protein
MPFIIAFGFRVDESILKYEIIIDCFYFIEIILQLITG